MKTYGRSIVAGIALLIVTLVAAPAEQAFAYTDGMSWTNCSGRTIHGQVTWSASGRTNNLTVFRCSNGYFFARQNSNVYSDMNVQLSRANLSGYQQSSAHAYSVATNMLAMRNGACYSVRGYVYGTSRTINFCW